MKMVSTKLAKQDKTKSAAKDINYPRQDYPYSTRVEIDGDMLDKMGMTLPKVGDKLKMQGHGHVVSASSHQNEDGTSRRSATLQLTHMGVEKKSSTPASALEAVESGVSEADED